MTNTILICGDGKIPTNLETQIEACCPQLNISKKADCIDELEGLLINESPSLLFVDLKTLHSECIGLLRKLVALDWEIIFLAQSPNFTKETIGLCTAGYLLKPIRREDLMIVVKNATEKIQLKTEIKRSRWLIQKMMPKPSGTDRIGVPTIEGFDFFSVDEIYRCEGLQKCTRIITGKRSNIISSYHLGAFRKLLEPYCFFSPHKSHLVNLRYIKQYKREGTIIMADDSAVPVSRRKKREFLDCIIHIGA